MAQQVKNLPTGFDPQVGKLLWRRAWRSTPVFLPRVSHEQRNLAGCSPWDPKESDMTDQLSTEAKLAETQETLRVWWRRLLRVP